MASNGTKKRPRSSGNFCGAVNCTNSFYKEECKGKSFFTFPKDKERCQLWIQNTRRADLIGNTPEEIARKNIRLCSDHFQSNQFNVPHERKRLIWNAVPTLFQVPNPPSTMSTKRKCPTHLPIEEVPHIKKEKQAEDCYSHSSRWYNYI